MRIVYVLLTVLFAVAAYSTYQQNGWMWVSVGMAFATVFLGLGSIVESLILRIELTDDALVVTDLRGRRSYARGDIERIEEAKASPPAIRLKRGEWVKLPSVGDNVGNSVRAWLKQQP